MPVDVWLSAWFSGSPGPIAGELDALADRLDELFSKRNLRKQRLTLSFTGWALDDAGVMVPMLETVANMDHGYTRLARFVHPREPRRALAGWKAVGGPLPRATRVELNRRTRAGLGAGISAPVVVDLFLRAQRATARGNKLVGRPPSSACCHDPR